ncbi:lactate utilization protein C [Streptomyces griseus]|uniref:LutC/YkgG family protein n=1 Tax=Streptomyces griseus TaxID=1911 RepID=UPI0004C92259|nr:lactate utilization protein C [Streptomyces griseus]
MSRDSRERILSRIRSAVGGAPEAPEVPRAYLSRHAPGDPDAVLDLLHENLADYRAHVHRADGAGLPALIGRLLEERGARTVVVPDGLPARWPAAWAAEPVPDTGLAPADLDAVDAVVTGCALAVAETGTIVLDGGPGQGRRALTLVPDLHVCVVREDQVVASVPEALPRLDPRRALTWISGPSATSDIELDRVEGVHGPRILEVVLVRGPV